MFLFLSRLALAEADQTGHCEIREKVALRGRFGAKKGKNFAKNVEKQHHRYYLYTG